MCFTSFIRTFKKNTMLYLLYAFIHWYKTIAHTQIIYEWSRKQQSAKQQLYGHLPPISQTIQVRRARYAGNCCRDEFITLTQGHTSVGWPAKTYIQQLCVDTGCRLQDLPKAMANRDGWRERFKGICTVDMPWRWWKHSSKISENQNKTFTFLNMYNLWK